jgi:hypothetical protein
MMKKVRIILALAVGLVMVALVVAACMATAKRGDNLPGDLPVAGNTTSEIASSARSAKVAALPPRRPPEPRSVRSEGVGSDAAASDSEAGDASRSPHNAEFKRRFQQQFEFLQRVRGLPPEQAEREAIVRVAFRGLLNLRDDQLEIAEPAAQKFVEQVQLWNDFQAKINAVYHAVYGGGARGEEADRSVRAACVPLEREAFPAIIKAHDNCRRELEKLRPQLDPEQVKLLDEELASIAEERAMLVEGLAEDAKTSLSP